MSVPLALIGLLAIIVGTYAATVVSRATQRMVNTESGPRPETYLWVWPRWLLGAVVGLLAALLLYQIRSILTPFVVGMVLAYSLNPLIELLGKRGLPRHRAIGLVFLGMLALALVGLVLIVPLVIGEAQDLVRNYSTYVEQIHQFAARAENLAIGYAEGLGLLPQDVFAALGAIGDYLQKWGLQVLLSLLDWLKSSSSLLLAVVVIAPIVSFWLLRDYHVLGRVLLDLVPEKQRASTVEVAGDINRIVGSYLLGMATMAALVGAYASLVLLLLGVPFAVLLGLMTGVLSIIPYLGFPTAITVIAITMGVTGMGVVKIGVMIGLLLLGNLVSDNLVYPRVIGRRVGLHPLVIIFSLMAGGAVLNFLGMLLAVPTAGVIKALLLRFWPEMFAPETPSGQ